MPDSPLSFASLEERLRDYVKSTTSPKEGRLLWWITVIGFAGGGAGVAAANVVGGWLGMIVALSGLLLELLGLAAVLTIAFLDARRTFVRHRQQYSRELDAAYVGYRQLVDWLCSFPPQEVARRQRYLRDRKATLGYRLGLFTGGMERLGVLPVLVVLYLQFKDWGFGDWHALGQIHLIGALLLWALLLAYLIAWLLVGVKSRIDFYDALLTEAIASADAGVRKQTPV